MGIFNKRTVVCSCERCHCTCGGCHCCQCGVEQQVSRPPSFWGGLFSFWTSSAPDEEAMGQDYAPAYYEPTYQRRPQPRYEPRGCALPAPEPEYQPGQEMIPYSGPKFDPPGGFEMDMPFQFPEMSMPEWEFGE